MDHFGSPSESLTLSEFGNNSSVVEAQIDQFVVGIMGPNINKKDLEVMVVQQQVSDIIRANNDLLAIKQFRITNEKSYKDKELAAIRRKEIYEPLTNALTQVEILEERITRRDQLIEQLRRQILSLNIEKRETDEIISARNFHFQNSDMVEKVKVEQLKDEIVMLNRKADQDGLLIGRCRKTMKTQQDKIKSLTQLNEKIEFHFKEKIKQLDSEKSNLSSLADSKDAKIEQLIEARDFLNQHHQDLQEAMDDCLAQLKDAKNQIVDHTESIKKLEGEAEILSRNWKETLDLYNEKNEECIVLNERTSDLQSRYDNLVLEMDKMVEFGFNKPPPTEVIDSEEEAGPRSRANSSADRKKRLSKKSISIRSSISHKVESFTDEVDSSNNIMQSIKDAQNAVAMAELKEKQEQQLKGLFTQRKAEQDAVAEELRKASAAMRIKEQLEETIVDLKAKLAEEKTARELSAKGMLEEKLALEARRKEEVSQLHQKAHKHERQFHTLNEMFNAESAKVQRLEAQLENMTRQHEDTLEAHLQVVDQLKEQNEQLASIRSEPDVNLVRDISGQFIDLHTGRISPTPDPVHTMIEDEQPDFNDSAVLSRTGSVHPETSDVEEEEMKEFNEEEEAAMNAEYDMFAYMLSWKNVQLNSKGTETVEIEPTKYAEASVQFDLNKDIVGRLVEKQSQTMVMESTVESYLDVLFTDFVSLSRMSVPSVGKLANDNDKFVVQNYGFSTNVPIPQGTIVKPPAPQAIIAQTEPKKSIIIQPSSNRPSSPKTPSVGSTRPISPGRPISPKPPVSTSPVTTPAVHEVQQHPAPVSDENQYNFFGSESDVIFRHRRAINYLASLNDIRNLAVKDLNRLPVGGTLNSRVLIRSIDIFMQTLHILLSNATNDPTPKKTETSDYTELLRTVDTENEDYDDEIGEGHRDGVEEAILERIDNPAMEDRPLSVHRPRTSVIGDTFKLTQTVLATAETAAGARRGLLSPKPAPKPKTNKHYMNRTPGVRKAVPNVDSLLEKVYQEEQSRSRQNSPERARLSDSDVPLSEDEFIGAGASDDEKYMDQYGQDAKERNAAAMNRYYNFNREKSFIENKEKAMLRPGTQFSSVETEAKKLRLEDDVSIRSPVLEPHPEPLPVAPEEEKISQPRGPLPASRYKFKSMMRSTSSNASEADSDYIDYTRLKFKPFSESNNAYNNEKISLKPSNRSLKPAIPRVRTAGPSTSSRHRSTSDSLHTNSGVVPGLPSIDHYHSSAIASIPSASVEKEGGPSGSQVLAEKSIALSENSSFYFNYSEDENDHKYLPLAARFRNNNKSPPRSDRVRVRTAPATAPEGTISLSAQPIALAASPNRTNKKTSKTTESSVESSLLSSSTNTTTPAIVPPPVGLTFEESLSLLDITMHLAPPLPGTHLMTSTQVQTKLQKLNSAKNNNNNLDMLLVGNPANAESVTVMKNSPAAPMQVTRPTSGSSTTRPSPRVKGIIAPVSINMPTTYFGGPLSTGIAGHNPESDNRLDLSSANKQSRQ